MSTLRTRPAPPAAETIGLLVEAAPGPGILHDLTGVMARHRADIKLVEILESERDGQPHLLRGGGGLGRVRAAAGPGRPCR